MTKKISFISLLTSIFDGSLTKEDKVEAEEFIETKLGNDYGEYLKKSEEYHDAKIKHMYRNTSHRDKSPSQLREILREQVTGPKVLLQ